MPSRTLSSTVRGLLCWSAVCLATVTNAPRAQASFHTNWSIDEVYYTSGSGTVQFIELFNSSKSEQSLAGKEITITDIDTGKAHTITLPASLPGTAANHDLLIGTADLDAADGQIPNFIMPDDFMFTDPIYITMGGVNNGPYCPYSASTLLSLPANPGNGASTTVDVNNGAGALSALDPSGASNQLNATAQAASTGSGAVVVHDVPEPSSFVLLACGGLGVFYLLLRRRAV